MCLAIPAQITEIEGTSAKVVLQGNTLEADTSLVDEPAVGDWVLVHAGFAIEKLDPEDAEETLKLFAEMEEEPHGIGGAG
jgi:hydrogenase expression/formation protein HypC